MSRAGEQRTGLEERIKMLESNNNTLAVQLQEEKAKVTSVQQELSQTREMARGMSDRLSAKHSSVPRGERPIVKEKVAPKSVQSKVRGALLAGLRSGKLAKAVDTMEEAGGQKALALKDKNSAKSPLSRTRGALLAGLRSGKLQEAVDSIDGDSGPPKVKSSTSILPLRDSNGDVMAVQVKNMGNDVHKAYDKSLPICSSDGGIMAVQLKRSDEALTVLEGEFHKGASVDPVMGIGGDVLAVRVPPSSEKDKASRNNGVSVRDSQGNVMAFRVS